MSLAVPQLRTPRLLLTIPDASAAEARLQFEHENRRHLAPWNPTTSPSERDVDYWRASLERGVVAFRNGSGYAFSIFDRATGSDGPLLGYANFSQVVRGVFLACYLGYALAERAQGHGYMTEALRAGIDYMFETVRLHRIMANYRPHNERSAAVLRGLGFVTEGHARAYLHIAGAWRDHVLTSLTNPNAIEPDDVR